MRKSLAALSVRHFHKLQTATRPDEALLQGLSPELANVGRGDDEDSRFGGNDVAQSGFSRAQQATFDQHFIRPRRSLDRDASQDSSVMDESCGQASRLQFPICILHFIRAPSPRVSATIALKSATVARFRGR